MTIFLYTVDHDVGPTPGGGLTPDSVVPRVYAWSHGDTEPAATPDDFYAVEDTDIDGDFADFVTGFFNYWYDSSDGSVTELPDTARDTPAGETRNLSEDARLDTRPDVPLDALKRATKRSIFQVI